MVADALLPPAEARLMAAVRVLVGVLWLSNTGWKTPPDFPALRAFTAEAVEHPVFPPFSWLVEHVVLENFTPFGWLVLGTEVLLGALLVVGLFTRAAAIVGALMSVTIMLSVALAPGEWPWSYYLMIGANLTLFATAAGRTWGLDGLVRAGIGARTDRGTQLVRKMT
jgi:thiosulfate dehydrogenase (quinone) large subunit